MNVTIKKPQVESVFKLSTEFSGPFVSVNIVDDDGAMASMFFETVERIDQLSEALYEAREKLVEMQESE